MVMIVKISRDQTHNPQTTLGHNRDKRLLKLIFFISYYIPFSTKPDQIHMHERIRKCGSTPNLGRNNVAKTVIEQK